LKTAENLDDQLIQQFNRGEPRALTRVYDKYYDALNYFAYRLIENTSEAEDIVIEVLEILLRRYQDFETMANVKAFLYISVRNRCLKYLQAIQRLRENQKRLLEDLNNPDNYVLIEMVRAELMDDIYREIESLPSTRRSVFKLFFVDGLSTEEISAKLNMKPDTVWVNKSKALHQLRNKLINKKLLSLIAGIYTILTYRTER
jgi:RNA polymerase sigma factor (sigma-70 family)